MAVTALETQQNFALSSGLRSIIVWDEFSSDESHILKDKIKILFPDGEGSNEAIEKMRQKLFENLWNQRKYSNMNLLSAIIYVIVTEKMDFESAKQSTVYTHHPVFRIRKCINGETSAGCCMIFVDEHARVYDNWDEYLKDNLLPEGVMIAPANGVYTFNEIDNVEIICRLTPAAAKLAKIVRATDTAATVTNVMASAPLLAAFAFPVTAPIIAAATAVALTTSLYTTARSVYQLTDRRSHSQSTALTDSQARNSWLNIAGGIVGLGAAGATKILRNASLAGKEITMANKLAVCGINCTSVVMSGSGVASNIHYLYMKVKDDERVGTLDVLQLSSSLLVFTHSINNLRIATKVTTNSANNRALRSNLTNQMREDMQRSVATVDNESVSEVIRPLNDIPNRDTFTVINSINRFLRSFVGISTLATGVATTGLPGINVSDCNDEQLLHLILELGNTFYNHIKDMQSIADIVSAMSRMFAENVVYLLLKIANTFIDLHVDIIEGTLKSTLSSELILYKVLMHCVKNYKEFSYEFLESQTVQIMEGVRKYFDSLKAISGLDTKIKCNKCTGYYYNCNI